jgi:hypothetical protein
MDLIPIPHELSPKFGTVWRDVKYLHKVVWVGARKTRKLMLSTVSGLVSEHLNLERWGDDRIQAIFLDGLGDRFYS